MRKISTGFILFFAINCFGQTPNYFANNPTWHCGEWNSDQWDGNSDPYTDHYIYYLNGDTTLLGFTYHIVYKKGIRDYDYVPGMNNGFFNFQTNYFIRQEGKSIRFYSPQIVDSLLVSYDYVVGDMVDGYVFQGCDHAGDTIQKIDSILINSEYRKVFYLDTISGPVITEGIGHQLYVGGEIGELFFQMCAGIGFDYYVHCYGQNEIPLWDSYGNGGDCYLNVGVDENTELDFQIFPNPVCDYLQMTNTDNIERLLLYSLDGKVIEINHQKNISLINLTDVESGIYVLTILLKDGSSVSKKIIKH